MVYVNHAKKSSRGDMDDLSWKRRFYDGKDLSTSNATKTVSTLYSPQITSHTKMDECWDNYADYILLKCSICRGIYDLMIVGHKRMT